MFRRIFAIVIITTLIFPAACMAEEIRDYDMPIAGDIPLEQSAKEETLAVDELADSPAVDVPATADADNLDADHEALLQAQKRLITLGYLKGAADGIYGPMTETAISSFQESNSLSATGHLDQETFSLLNQLVANTSSTVEIQQRLIELGYLQGTADGKWGPRSTAAMKAFQELNNLSVTGTINDTTTAVLFSDDVIALPAGLAVGSKGDEVVALQQKLIQFGFLNGKADGAYGNQTSKAVKAFQEHLVNQGYNLSTDGEASPVTIFYLNQPVLTTYISDVSLGSTGSEAKRVETRLASLGYMDATPDEEFDEYAVEALELFQETAALSITGVADRITSDQLFSSTAPAADRCVLHEIAKGDKGMVVSYVQQALFTGGMAAIMPNGKYGSDEQTAIERLYEYAQEAQPSAAPLFSDSSTLSKEAVTVLLDGILKASGSGTAAEKTVCIHSIIWASMTLTGSSAAVLNLLFKTSRLPTAYQKPVRLMMSLCPCSSRMTPLRSVSHTALMCPSIIRL